MALVPGSFNKDLPGFQIKFDEKYGENENMLKNVLIYDLTKNNGNQKVITAERGKIVSEEGSRYMTMTLYNGYYFEEHVKSARTPQKRQKLPASSATFKEYEFNIDIGDTMNDGKLDSINGKGSPMMFSLKEIGDTIPKLKQNYDERIAMRAKNIFANTWARELYKAPDSIKRTVLDSVNILNNFDLQSKINILNSATTKSSRALSNLKNYSGSLKWKRKVLNFYDIEYYNRVAFSLSCIILFFIGASLGSIIRKGGFGLPMVLAIGIYVVYFFSNSFGRNLAEESTITSLLASWISAIIMIPIALLLTRRATQDKGIFNFDAFVQPVTSLINKYFIKKSD
jgi:lipopolysaccharide export system permease protein